MAHIGTLILAGEDGRELSVEVGGGLDSYVDRDGGLRIRGVVNVKGDALELARRTMEQARMGEAPMARYSGQVYSEDRKDVRTVDNMRVRIAGVNETGNLQVESDETLSA
jgi:hypothetical protein